MSERYLKVVEVEELVVVVEVVVAVVMSDVSATVGCLVGRP
jgi:hypothetical protein